MFREEVKILVVDDVNSMRVQIKDLLRAFGFRNVKVAGNGEEAKLALDAEPFHLILSDWQMAPTSGFDLLQYIRQHPTLKEIAFIMVTAEGTKDNVINAIRSGVDAYLIKPLTIAQIQDKVYGVLMKKKVL